MIAVRLAQAAAEAGVAAWLAFSGIPQTGPVTAGVCLLAVCAAATMYTPLTERLRRREAPPQNMRLIMADTGEVVPCGVLREPYLDDGGYPGWLLVPLIPVAGRLSAGFRVEGRVPAGAILGIIRDRAGSPG